MPVLNRRDFHRLLAFSGAPALCTVGGCGTLLHPERRDQVHSHQIDWRVAALDGLGLILFFVPGVAAFAVDFYTGAIYLPPEEYGPQNMEYIGQAPTDEAGIAANGQESATRIPWSPAGGLPILPSVSPATAIEGPQEAAAPVGSATRTSTSLQQTRNGRKPHPDQPGSSPPAHPWRQVASAHPIDSPASVEDVVAQATGRRVALDEPSMRASQVPTARQLDEHLERHRQDRRFGFAAINLLRRWRGVDV